MGRGLLVAAAACWTGCGKGGRADSAGTSDTASPTDGTGGSDGRGGGDGRDDPPVYGDPIETGDEVCYLGEDRAGTTCLPVVAWDPDWGSDYAYPSPLDDRYARPIAFLDLEGAADDPDLPVAPNFVLGELVSASKGRFALLQPHLVASLQDLRDAVGGPVLVTSGYRSPGYNAGIDGSATYSRHMYGDAADLYAADLSIDALADLCEDLGAGYVGTYVGHVHCDWRDAPLEPALFGSPDDADTAAPPPASARVAVHGTTLQIDLQEGFSEGQPLITWRAWSATGALLATTQGPHWTPPPSASRVTVDVGRQVQLEHALP